ncbi:MAG: SIS domain-containing protein, partial [Mycoplasmatales bacterium]
DYNMLLHASIEIAVASTKAYTANIAVSGILVGLLNDNVSKVFSKLETVIIEQQKILDRKDELKTISLRIARHKEAIMIGRLLDYDIALEASLKIKEVTYTNINCYQGGELKHGPISLIDKKMLVLALIGQENIAESTRSNIEEIKARNGQVITFVRNDLSRNDDDFKFDFEVDELYVSMVSAIPFQYISYYIAIELGFDVDKPRNLAKAVTVE